MLQRHNMYIYYFAIIILHFYSSEIVNASSSEEFIVISDNENNFENEHPGKLIQKINNLQKFMQREMLRIENNIVIQVRYEAEKLNDKIIQNSKQISAIENKFNQKFDDISVKLQFLQNITKDVSVRQNLLDNFITNITTSLSSLATTRENQQKFNSISQTSCTNAINLAINSNNLLTNIYNSTLESVGVLKRVLNVSHDISSKLNCSNTHKNNEFGLNKHNETIQNPSNINKSEIVRVTTSTDKSLKESHEAEWNWSKCNEETVPNTRSIGNEQLHPLSTAGGGRGGGGEAHLRVTFRGDMHAHIYLAREERVDIRGGLYFDIFIFNTGAILNVREAGVETTIKYTSVGSNISSSWDTRVALTIADGSLEVRTGDLSSPLLVARDPRFSQVHYIGFDTSGNTLGYATFKFGC